MTTPTNLLADIPVDLTDELFQTLLSTPGLLVERIVSLGHASPDGDWMDQDRHEWVLLLQGAARLAFEGAAPVDLVGNPLRLTTRRLPREKPDQPQNAGQQRAEQQARSQRKKDTEVAPLDGDIAWHFPQPRSGWHDQPNEADGGDD
jgi:cupin 2 domain-containing protein